ncbi:hypothetical protein [Streptomyces arboris]|uniref:hypothetical protein n=1 Tax=Streptomyces arboris TaxID=2600619 RepID=UPI00178C1BE0|nr:hypothetical protein [Streptomyces arboris]
MVADLYTLYMDAHRTWADHATACGTCTADQPACPTGTRLWSLFARHQDEYLNRNRKRP